MTASAVVPASAGASATFGADLSPAPFISTATNSLTQVMDPGGAATPGAPIGGVLTSVRIHTTGGSGTGVIRMLRLTARPDANTYTFLDVGDVSVPVTADATTAGHITSVDTQLTIAAGDRLSWGIDDAASAIKEDASDATAQCAYTGTTHAAGTTHDYSTVGCNNNVLLVSGTVERDADSDGFGDDTQDQCFTDPSTQTVCPVPTITGRPRTGQTLTGTPNGSPMNPGYAWLRCDVAGAACSAIAGATSTTYVVGTADQGHALRFRKTATNSAGAQTSDSAATTAVPTPTPTPTPPLTIVPPVLPPVVPAVVVAPVLSELSLKPAVFGAARGGPSALAARKSKAGAVISYRDSQSARTTFSVISREPGTRKGRRCVRASSGARGKAKRCIRLVAKGTFSHADRAGPNRLRFTGRVKNNKLRPGRYELRVAARNRQGKQGRTLTRRFRIRR